MYILTIIYFVACAFFLGLTATFFAKNSDNFLERNLMRIGFGLSLIPFLGLALNLMHLPIDWRLMLAISILYPVYHLARYRPPPKLKLSITKTDVSIILMLIIFSANLYVYVSGAFEYPYLEDDDSWSHAMGVKYVASEKKVYTDSRIFHYIDPYPPTYDLLLGLLHQTNDSVYFTLKFFNALIVSLSTIFFYFLVKEMTQNKTKALFASFVLASVPAYMSHFIWALTLTVPLFFVAFYCLERIKYDAKWWIISGMVMVTAFTSSPTHSTYFGLFLGFYLLTKTILERKFLKFHLAGSLLGISMSFIFWWLPMILKHGFKGTLEGIGIAFWAIKEVGISGALGGTGDRVYTFADFFIAKDQNMVNNPIGIGWVVCLLAIIAIIILSIRFRDWKNHDNHWIAVILVWFFFTLYAVNAAKFTIKLSPFRAWMLFAIPVSILAAEGAINLGGLARQLFGKIGKYLVFVILIVGIYFTSAHQKIAVNTSPTWPFGGFWTSADEVGGYVWIKDNLPPNAKMFTFYNNAPVIGMDKYTCHWCKDVRDYMDKGFNETSEDNYRWLRQHEYAYIVIDGQTANKFGSNESNTKIQEFITSGKFKPVYGNNGLIVLQIL